jgi:hypothetical protein
MYKKDLKDFVEAGYKTKSDAKNIGNYILDEDLSTKRNKVYYDPDTGKAIHTIAGTDTAKDWSNNALIPLGLHEYSNRHKNSEKIQNKANDKYGKSNVDLVTHSQSGHIAENLANKNLVGGLNTTLNPAIIGNHNKDVTVYKSIFDPVSLLTNTNKNDYNIMPKSFNPITEHSTNILDKTRKNIFGFGLRALKKGEVNKIMKYRSEDESEASTSESEEEHELKGMGLDEQKILKKMQSLHKDISKLHQKHGVKKSVIKGFKALGMGIINGAGPMMDARERQNNTSDQDWMNGGVKAAKILGRGMRMPPDTGPSNFVHNERETTRRPLMKLAGTGANARYRESQKGTTRQDWINGAIDANKTVNGRGATGKMLKDSAAGATAGLINSGANRAIYEMDTQGKKGTGFKKGSQEAKEWGRKMKEAREAKKK